MLKAIIVDDEVLAIHLLESMLKTSNMINVLATFTNPKEALKCIDVLKPDILFLDIEMAEMTGIELASKIESLSHKMDVIFVTAYEHYALEAFDVQATDYILKPIDRNRLFKTIERLYKRRNPAPSIQFSENVLPNEDAIIINTLHFHIYSGKVSIDDTVLALSNKEFQILLFLAQNSEQAFPASELYQLIWDEESIGQTQSLRVHISNLRKKLDAIPEQPAKIVMTRGSGYQLVFQ
ncbi:DNA-binding response regulator [Lysinibacillus piscis]|uniref:DNA-binding response regulator n=1 Tax=Lysinibacillus piscis TaxID=2518931 RepID=UPI00222E63CB|nr:DNA-binding response regulator [Lysinibacillus sp. KH24]